MPNLRKQIAQALNELLRRVMNPRWLYIVTGYLSIITGIAATLCIYKIQYLYYGVGLAIIGFILSVANIFLNERHGFDEVKFPKGYLGMFLSSLPVVFLILVIFKFRK